MPNDDKPIRLLLIEDDELSREFLSIQLSTEGYELTSAESGDDALLQMQQSSGPFPEAILTDLQMPGISGPELARQLRALAQTSGGQELVLVAMSASQPQAYLLEAYDTFLLKPFAMSQLREAVKSAKRASQQPMSADPDLAPGPASLDETVFRNLISAIPSQQLQELYALFLSDAEARIGRMRSAASNGDDTTYRKESHAIKGAASMVGATELHCLAATGEQQGIAHANHVASLDEMLMAGKRLRRILVEHESRTNK